MDDLISRGPGKSLGDGTNLGPYRIIGRIGRGGMSTVYKAHHRALDRFVALKVLPDFFSDDEGYRTRFKQEAQSIARLRHPNILSVFDFGQERGINYLVLELVEGGTLAERLGTPMDLHDAVAILQPLASAIDHAHAQGVIHRDIKPSNILMRPDGTPVLADFGLAQMAAAVAEVTSGTVIGTPAYMSPEQSAGTQIGPPSDIYSFAIVAYKMLTGRVPFEADTSEAVLVAHLNAPVPPPRELAGELSAHVFPVLKRALAKAPEDRFHSAFEFVGALTPAAWPTRTATGADEVTNVKTLGRGASHNLPKVLVVDDSAPNRELIEACLAGIECEVRLAEDGPSALKSIEASAPDLVLLDVQMPGMDGYQVCRQIKSDPRLHLVPVVMITALDRPEDRVRALEAGADDFLSKPVEQMELVARVRSALRLKVVYDRLDGAEQLIFALTAAVEARDSYTAGHGHQIAESARQVGLRLGLAQVELDALYLGAMIHDIGKVGVDDAILRKPGPLDSDELVKMRAHTVIGANIVRASHSAALIIPIIRHHHEWFDGSGYPDGLRGEAIPTCARIVAICDAYDSMINARPYRPGRSVAATTAILNEGAGTQWDPKLVELFLSELPIHERIRVA